MHGLARCCGKVLPCPKFARYWVIAILKRWLREGRSGFVTHPCLGREGLMSTLQTSEQDYLAMRRLRDARVGLNFVSFIERKRFSHITTDLATVSRAMNPEIAGDLT
jgi:hypothetical protein